MGWPKRAKSGCIMTRFGQSEMVIARNQPCLFDPQNSRDIAGTNRDKSGHFTPADARQSGQSGTPPLKGGVQCPAGTGLGMSRVPCPGSQALEKRNDENQTDPAAAFPTRASRAAAFAAWQSAGEPWPPPAGLVSAGMDRLQRGNRGGDQWRK
jgi:hypothetical protein